MAQFDDPIKAALGTAFHKTEKIIITTVELIGGDVTVIPERAPGKTISRKEKQRVIVMTRHGNDFILNLNLFLIPEKAREHLSDYLNGQRLNLERALVSIGYEAVFREGTRLVQALMRSNALAGIKSPQERAIMADQTFAEAIFGAFSKHQFAIENIMTLVAKANIYTPTGAGRSPYRLMIVPLGFREYDRTKPDTMYHYISGLTRTANQTVKIPLNTAAYTDPGTNIRVMVHVPVSGFRQSGTANPQVECNEMQSIESFAAYYIQEGYNPCIVTDFKARDWATLPVIRGAARYKWWLRPQMTCLMDSAILVTNPGPETGELVMQWPSTGISTSQTGESFRGKLRVYMAAYLKRPENVLILDCIKFAGIVAGAGSSVNEGARPYDEEMDDLLAFQTDVPPWDHAGIWQDPAFQAQCTRYGIFLEHIRPGGPGGDAQRTHDTAALFYRGTTRHNDSDRLRTRNNGHLGALDHPDRVLCIEGEQVFVPPRPTILE